MEEFPGRNDQRRRGRVKTVQIMPFPRRTLSIDSNALTTREHLIRTVAIAFYALLRNLDSDGNFKEKADMFTKRTIKKTLVVTNVDTSSEALAVSLSEKADVDVEYMAGLQGSLKKR